VPEWAPIHMVGDPTDGLIPEVQGYVPPMSLPYVDPWSIDPTYQPEMPESVFDAVVDDNGAVDLGVSYPKLSDLGLDEGMQQ
jgi:hypothetical protein